jgi:hypothetical protein
MDARFSPGKTIWMAFIMHACKKYSGITVIRRIIYLYVSGLILLLSQSSIAGINSISINNADGVIIENMYTVNAKISYQLGKESRNALEHGIPLEFDIDFRIKKRRLWLWDKTLVNKTITYRLEHQPLSGNYLVTRLDDGELEQFQNLEDVLKYIGKIKNFPLTDTSLLERDGSLYAQIKSHLNIEALPAPLRPLAYISTEWRLSSPWQTWVIKE